MTGRERIAEAFESARASGRRAALMPYLMGGFPDLATSLRSASSTPAPAPTWSSWAFPSPTPSRMDR